MKNFISKNESRIIFDYFKVVENLSNCHMKFSNKIHDNLSNSNHKILFSANLKHAYFTISMHSNDKHYFAFIIFEIKQIQSTKIQQKFKSTNFIMNEYVYRIFESLLPSIKKSSLLHSIISKDLSSFVFYMDDFFEDFNFFWRILWIHEMSFSIENRVG